MRSVIRPTLLVSLGGVLFLAACSRAPQRTTEVVAVAAAKLPSDPADPQWEKTPEHVEKMIAQDLVEPRLLTPSTPEVKVRAVTNGSEVAFRLEWPDDSRSDVPGPAKFIDACALQIPEKLMKDPPPPQMGEAGKGVQVTYWRADWQASVDGRGDTIRDLYPNAAIDHYPFNAQSLEKGSDAQKQMALRYAPARALGNTRSGPRTKPVEDLVAAGPGTLAPGPSLDSQAKGVFAGGNWSVVISRKLPEGLARGGRTQIAFAVWQGSQKEAGARKMRTGWATLLMRGE